MCLILFAHRTHAAYPLVVGANRDEFHARPTAPSEWWEDAPEVLAGRDLQGGGTWMGATRTGRFAAVTNVRDPALERIGAPSRGNLVADFLRGHDNPEEYLVRLAPSADQFNGFNLLVRDAGELWYLSNRGGRMRRLGRGVYGLSNAALGTAWPKTARGERALRELLTTPEGPSPDAVLEILGDRTVAADTDLPDTGVGAEYERLLAPAFITSDAYGTRASTALLVGADGTVTWAERSFGSNGQPSGEVRMHWDRNSPVRAH